MRMEYDLIVIGAGPAGLASALAAYEKGLRHILIVERDDQMGGILNQCIHNGFGLHHFKEELTGPEYAGKYIDQIKNTTIECLFHTMVVDITPDKTVYCTSAEHGYLVLRAKAIVLNMGCRERARGAIAIPGDRPSGIFTAGSAQRYVNIDGYLPGKNVLILGSGDIGLIMARRMTLEGACVKACVEIMPYSNGLNRNIVQCLQDYKIPLYLSHTIVDMKGKNNRLESVTIAQVDEKRNPIAGTEKQFDVDCVLLSVGLIPENELSKQAGIEMDTHTHGPIVYENMETSVPGIFASGNVVHVHDLVDFVSDESERAGKAAYTYITQGEMNRTDCIQTKAGQFVGYVVPQKIHREAIDQDVDLFFRVKDVFVNGQVIVKDGDRILATFKRNHMAPGEMQSIHLPKVLMQKIQGNQLMVEVQK